MKNNDKEPYINIPIWFIKLTSNKDSAHFLTPFQCYLYWLIRGLSNGKECYANNQYFAKTFNVSIKHINKSIHKLESLNMIYIKHEKNKRFIGVTPFDIGDVLYFRDEKNICITTEDNVYKFSREEWIKKSEDELKTIFMPKAV